MLSSDWSGETVSGETSCVIMIVSTGGVVGLVLRLIMYMTGHGNITGYIASLDTTAVITPHTFISHIIANITTA